MNLISTIIITFITIKRLIINSIIKVIIIINKELIIITIASSFIDLLIKVNSNYQKVGIIKGIIIVRGCIVGCIVKIRDLSSNWRSFF